MYPDQIDILHMPNKVWTSDGNSRLYFFFPQTNSFYNMKVDVDKTMMDWNIEGNQLTIGAETFEIIYLNTFYLAVMVLRDRNGNNRVYKESFYG